MKKLWLITIILFTLIIIVGVIIFKTFFYFSVPPRWIGIFFVNVSNNNIALKGTFADGFTWYSGYKVEYRDESLYIKIFGSIRRLPYSDNPFTITMPNTYGTIKAVYLEGATLRDRKLIWPAMKK